MMISSSLAVIMSVYNNDRLDWIKLACDSVLENTYSPLWFLIAVDGPVTEDIARYLRHLTQRKEVLVVFNSENKGLALRLNQLLDMALDRGVDFIARMDADDVSHSTRFEEQLRFFSQNVKVELLGTGHREVDEMGNFLFNKYMPSEHEELEKKIIHRCPFNHPTVMFRSAVFSRTGKRYDPTLQNTQDYYLWVDLLSEGVRFANISKPLLDFRIGEEFYTRRGAKKALNDFRARLYAMKRLECRSFSNFVVAVGLLSLRLSPGWVKVWAYKKLR